MQNPLCQGFSQLLSFNVCLAFSQKSNESNFPSSSSSYQEDFKKLIQFTKNLSLPIGMLLNGEKLNVWLQTIPGKICPNRMSKV